MTATANMVPAQQMISQRPLMASTGSTLDGMIDTQ
jgi:hypothetical protein